MTDDLSDPAAIVADRILRQEDPRKRHARVVYRNGEKSQISGDAYLVVNVHRPWSASAGYGPEIITLIHFHSGYATGAKAIAIPAEDILVIEGSGQPYPPDRYFVRERYDRTGEWN